MSGIVISFVLAFILIIVIVAVTAPDDKKTDGRGFTAADKARHGMPSPEMICPHCQIKGKVLTKPIVQKAGISGGKATGAIVTGGLSLLATGLSRKQALTEAFL